MKFKWLIKFKGYEIPVMTLIVFLVSFLWSIGMILAPLTLPANSLDDLSGSVGKVENQDITDDMNPYAKFYYESGDFNCHTKSERSFFVNGNQMPFCARDVAIFFGLTIGLAIALFFVFEIKWWWLIGGLVPIGIDGTVQLVTSYESNNAFRLITGVLAGLVSAFALGYIMWDASKMAAARSEFNQYPYEEEADQIPAQNDVITDDEIGDGEEEIKEIETSE
jgi:uncharacterized membrane protein